MFVNKDACNGDSLCLTVCPVEAITINPKDNKAEISMDICIECLSCMNICAQGAISE